MPLNGSGETIDTHTAFWKNAPEFEERARNKNAYPPSLAEDDDMLLKTNGENEKVRQ